jgi:SAM-dependent methyltransferase
LSGFEVLPYASTIFLSAFLLFLVQPLIAKQILPWFGGSAAVWTTCMLFFQTVLLLGYAYADGAVRWLRPRTQVTVHIVLLVLSLVSLPIIADASWKPTGSEEPILRILGLLAATIGLPYLMLSSTTPLMQAWYWQRYRADVPYRLFALSNFASLLALLGYPVLVEPWLSGSEAARYWSVLYGVFVVACGVTGIATVRAHAAAPAEVRTAPQTGPVTPLTAGTVALWLALAGMGSALLLAVTNHVTQNIASVPFLWVLPLALYLLTFIICFDHPRWYRREIFVPLLGLALPLMAWQTDSLDLQVAAPLFAAGLFIGCMFCHGELSRLRPDPRHLTLYYLMIALGGALGALIVAIGAPLALSGYYEMQIALVLVAVLALARLMHTHLVVKLGGFAVTVLVGWFAWQGVQSFREDVRVMERDFYGVVRTKDRMDVFPFRAMYHGAINHGGQLLDPKMIMSPTSYFGPTSGYGRVFASLPPGPRTVGVIGLGAGALAAYAQPQDHWVFYEIAPSVIRIAQQEFSYLKGSAAKTEIILGDGRLSLEREAPRGYDVLAIDAFSGDSIPMHLLTREALAVYLKHLKPDGVLVFQATNRFVDILPVIRRLADEQGLYTAHVADGPDYSEGPEYWLSGTDQVIVTRNPRFVQAPRIKEVAQPAPERKDLPVFTDDYYNLLRILKR